MRIQTKVPGLYYLGMTKNCKVKFEKDGKEYITNSNLGALRRDPSIRIVSKIDTRAIGDSDVLIFKRSA